MSDRASEELESASSFHLFKNVFFERNAAALLVVDRSGKVIAVNARARSILDPPSTEALFIKKGHIRAEDKTQDRALQSLLDHVQAQKEPAEKIESLALADGKLRLVIQSLGAHLVLHILAPETALRVDKQILQKLFSLSPAEASVAALLASGLSAQEIGVRLHISLHTVRSHLKKVFLKTNTSRQSTLVGLIHRVQQALPLPD